MLKEIKKFYDKERLALVDKDFLEYEEEMIRKVDLDKILEELNLPDNWHVKNPFNSIILYVTKLSDEFDFVKGRSDMFGGSPPDIDLDFDPRYIEKIAEYYESKFGKECVSHIGSYGTFGLQSIAQDNTRISEPVEPKRANFEDINDYDKALEIYETNKAKVWKEFKELDELIPAPKYGIAPTYEDMMKDHPEIEENFPNYNRMAKYANGMRKQFGVHAAGIVVSNFPIKELIPLFKNDAYERITQFDKDQVEELGLIKFDELVLDILSIISETIRLIEATLGIKIDLIKDIYENDGDKKAYAMLNHGLLTGIFQMETSPLAKKLIEAILPENIEHLSDISALNRPGPIQAGFDQEYVKNRKAGFISADIPPALAKILEKTYGVVVYQEQIMKICSDLAGFSPKEADDIRKAMGKKDKLKLEKYKLKFINQSVKQGYFTIEYATELWHKMEGFAEYAFNKCLSEDTKVITVFWEEKMIKDLEVGKDLLWCYQKNGTLFASELLDKIYAGEQELYEIELENGSIIKCTMEHKFLCLDKNYHTLKEILEKNLDIFQIE